MLEFVFEELPWEQELSKLQPGENMSALRLLTLLEEVDEDAAQEAMDVLNMRGVPFLVARAPRRNEKAMRMLRRAGFEWAKTDCYRLGRDL